MQYKNVQEQYCHLNNKKIQYNMQPKMVNDNFKT